MDKQKTILAALAALVGLGWLFRKGGSSGTVMVPTPTTGQAAIVPASPQIVVVKPESVADRTVTNQAPAAQPVPAASTVTAASQFANQGEYDEYQRRVQGLGW